MQHRTCVRGFTLIELIIVMVIFAILVAGALLVDITGGVTAYNDAQQIATAIRYAQSLSMTHDANYTVTMSSVSSVWQYQILLSGVAQINPTTGSTAPVVISSTLAFSSAISSGSLSFDGRGVPYGNSNTPLSSAATVTLTFSGEKSQIVQIAPKTGNVQVIAST